MPRRFTKGGKPIVNNLLGFFNNPKKSKTSKTSKKSRTSKTSKTSKKSRTSTRRLTKKQVKSTSGRISPPVDATTNNLQKVRDVIEAGPITVILVHLIGCVHCLDLMPHWDKATHMQNRSVQTVKVEESMLPKVNAVLSTMNNKENSIKVEGYPSGFLVSKKGDIIEEISLSPETLPTLMTKTGPIADEMVRREGESEGEGEGEGEGEEEEEEEEEEEGEGKGEGEGEGESKEAEKPNMKKVNNFLSVKPSDSHDDIEVYVRTKPSTGGSLYSLMAKTTYTLAPTIALLATAKAIMKSKRNKGSKRNGWSTRHKYRARK
jgi:hypothetical protein